MPSKPSGFRMRTAFMEVSLVISAHCAVYRYDRPGPRNVTVGPERTEPAHTSTATPAR